MADDLKNDDDYQFPQDEYAGSEQPASAEVHEDAPLGGTEQLQEKRSGWAGKLKTVSGGVANRFAAVRNKRILIVIGGVILLLVIINTMRSGQKLPETPSTPSLSTQQPQAYARYPAQSQPEVQLPSFQQPLPSTSVEQPSSPETQEALGGLRQQISDLKSKLSDAQQTNQQLQKSVADLTGQVRDLSTQLSAVVVRLMPKKETPRETITYHLRAVVPDRAWIISSNGDTITVAVGDKIDQYGVVRAIDAPNGIIDTSSGRKIGYGVNDY